MSDRPLFAAGRFDDAADLIVRYHYSGRVPANVQFVATQHAPGGLFGDLGDPIAACCFSLPPTRWSEPVWELTRLVRRDDAAIQLTGLIGWACQQIRRTGRQDLLVSFADWTHAHHGGIYQAASWAYHGQRAPSVDGVIVAGHFYPGRAAVSRFGTRSPSVLAARYPDRQVDAHRDLGKHLYWRALTGSGVLKATRLQLGRQPYPKPHDRVPHA